MHLSYQLVALACMDNVNNKVLTHYKSPHHVTGVSWWGGTGTIELAAGWQSLCCDDMPLNIYLFMIILFTVLSVSSLGIPPWQHYSVLVCVLVCVLGRAGLRGRQSRQPPRAPGFRGPPNAKNRAPACSYQKIEIL